MANSTRLYEQSSDNSEALVMQHLGLVKRVALHLKVRIPPFMELDELIQVGMIGLLEAARAFNPDKGVDFENFALSRVRGAILDEVRQLSYLPRSAVAFNKSESRATDALATELGRAPTQIELAEHLGDDIESFHKKRGNASRFETFPWKWLPTRCWALPTSVHANRRPSSSMQISCVLSRRLLPICQSETS
jgi:RNA polymerase sigma factor for flagellar operon FliA